MGTLRFPGVGERLSQALMAKGYTKRGEGGALEPDRARFLREVGQEFTPQSFYPWVNGERTPDLDSLTRLAELLDVPRAWLLLGDGPAPKGMGGVRQRRMAPIAGGSDAPEPLPAALTQDVMPLIRRALTRIVYGWGWLPFGNTMTPVYAS